MVKFFEKIKTHVKNLKIEEIIAFDKYLHELFFVIFFHLSRNLFLALRPHVGVKGLKNYLILFGSA